MHLLTSGLYSNGEPYPPESINLKHCVGRDGTYIYSIESTMLVTIGMCIISESPLFVIFHREQE